MAATLEKRDVMLRVGQLLDQCRECPKSESDTRTEKERAAVCGGCPVYAGFLKYREFLGAYEDSRNKSKRKSKIHLLTPDKYKRYKADGWRDDDILHNYNIGRTTLARWKNKHFSKDEIKAMQLQAGRKKMLVEKRK